MLAGAGLCVLVVMSLLRAGEQARAQQELDAHKGAQAMAQALRAALRQPAVLALTDERERFAVADGRIVLPAPVGWLEPAAPLPVDVLAQGKLDAAARAEFVDGDAAAAARAFDELLGERGPQGRARLPGLAAATWQAQRGGDSARVLALAGELHAAFAAATPGQMAQPETAMAVSASLLLDAVRAVEPSPITVALVPALPTDVAEPLLRRLQERRVEVAAWRAAQREVASERVTLVAIERELARTGEPWPRARGGRLLLWFPDAAVADGASGRGAFADVVTFADRLRTASLPEMAPVPDLGELAYQPPGDGGAVVVDGLWWIAPRTGNLDVPWPARPVAALLAAAVLLLVLLGSGLFAARSLRQQALLVRARAEFLTVVTHELKTPLAAIRLLAEMLVERRVPVGKTEEYYRLLAGEAARLSMLIENVLDLGRMERGERAYDLRACDLGEVAQQAVALFAPIAQRDGLELRTQLADGPAAAHADRGALLQALLNVLDNARKYAGDGGAIELRAHGDGAAFTLTVRDFGPGVAKGEREAIFARFRRGDAHRHGSIPGVGLGLHLARAIVRRHGGELLCQAPGDGGAGAEFVFTLPLATARVEALS